MNACKECGLLVDTDCFLTTREGWRAWMDLFEGRGCDVVRWCRRGWSLDVAEAATVIHGCCEGEIDD